MSQADELPSEKALTKSVEQQLAVESSTSLESSERGFEHEKPGNSRREAAPNDFLSNKLTDSNDSSGSCSSSSDIISNNSSKSINKRLKLTKDYQAPSDFKISKVISSSLSNASKFIGTTNKATVRRKRALRGRCRRRLHDNLNLDADHDHDGDIDRSDDEDCDNIEDDYNSPQHKNSAGHPIFASSESTHFASACRWHQDEPTSLRLRMRGGQNATDNLHLSGSAGGDNDQDDSACHDHSYHPKQDRLSAVERKVTSFSDAINDNNNNCNTNTGGGNGSSSSNYFYGNNRQRQRYKKKFQGVKKFNSSHCSSSTASSLSFLKSNGIDSSTWSGVYFSLRRFLGFRGQLLQRDELNLPIEKFCENQIPSYRKVSDSRPFEWQSPTSSYLDSMPVNNYGTSDSRTKPPRIIAKGEYRSARRLSSKSLSQRDQQRYYRLGYQHHIKRQRETTVFQEYASLPISGSSDIVIRTKAPFFS